MTDTRGAVVLVEVEAVEEVVPVHEAQLLAYLKLLGLPLGLLIDLNVEKLVDGVTRRVNEFHGDVSAPPLRPLRLCGDIPPRRDSHLPIRRCDG